jgi:hypothetical protein
MDGLLHNQNDNGLYIAEFYMKVQYSGARLLWYNLDEQVDTLVPVVQQGLGLGASCFGKVALQFCLDQQLVIGVDYPVRSPKHCPPLRHPGGFVQYEGHATGHAGTEIAAHRTEYGYNAAGHVFAAVVAQAFDHRSGA